MSEEKYFQREYNYLQIAGEEFARKHRTLGAQLRLTERQRKDPFVERLLEAFAFLCGRVHERLDDEIPEFTGALLEQLFPHFLRPFPSCAVLEIRPSPGAISQPTLIPRGSEIQTPGGRFRVKYKVAASPMEPTRTIEKTEPAEFIFRTTQDCLIRPLRLKAVTVEDTADGNSALVLRFQPDRNVTFEALDLKRLRLYLQGNYRQKYTLLLYLSRYVVSVEMRELTGANPSFQPLGKARLSIPELSPEWRPDGEEDCSIVPYSRHAFPGYRLLHEYFSYPERFFFVDVEGLNTFPASGDGHPFEVKFHFDRKLSSELRPTPKDILLHCVPIVNLFDRPTEEVVVDQRLPEYYIIPDLNRRKSREIFSVNRVVGVGENKQEQFPYSPVASYDMLTVDEEEQDFKRFYSIVTRPIKGDMAETHIRLFGPGMEAELFPKQTLSIQATLSNGFLPAKYLQVGTITEPIDFPPGLEARNITVPSELLLPPQRQNFLWALIAHVGINYQTLAQTETLKTILHLYNWVGSHANPNQKRIEGIVKVHPPKPRTVYRNRGLIRGIEFRIDIDGQHFENGEGEIHLFGLVLSRFLAQYVTLNSFVMLTMTEIETKREYTWLPIPGNILPV
ncbi:MAG: type VI secretion system baseplate subunit TssF [Calditrichaeota bacterium]|nr:MAG: type VI secretion system baseplate subunit TssF [Calditrichota bacterium]